MVGELFMITFSLVLLCIGAGSAMWIILYAMKGAIGHNTPEHGLPSRAIMRRYMLMGLYCNPDDPRTVVQHPRRKGWTLNMRSEQAAAALWITVAVPLIAAIILIALLLNGAKVY
jgi:uncharacterized membrane protein